MKFRFNWNTVIVLMFVLFLVACNSQTPPTNTPAPTVTATEMPSEALLAYRAGEAVTVEFSGNAAEFSIFTGRMLDRFADGTHFVNFEIPVTQGTYFYSEVDEQFLADFGGDFVSIGENNYSFDGANLVEFGESHFDLTTMSASSRVSNGVAVTVRLLDAAPIDYAGEMPYVVEISSENRSESIPTLYAEGDAFYTNGTKGTLLQSFGDYLVEIEPNVFTLSAVEYRATYGAEHFSCSETHNPNGGFELVKSDGSCDLILNYPTLTEEMTNAGFVFGEEIYLQINRYPRDNNETITIVNIVNDADTETLSNVTAQSFAPATAYDLFNTIGQLLGDDILDFQLEGRFNVRFAFGDNFVFTNYLSGLNRGDYIYGEPYMNDGGNVSRTRSFNVEIRGAEDMPTDVHFFIEESGYQFGELIGYDEWDMTILVEGATVMVDPLHEYRLIRNDVVLFEGSGVEFMATFVHDCDRTGDSVFVDWNCQVFPPDFEVLNQ